MIGWDALAGAERPRALLARATESGDAAHGYLFAGPEGVGKRQGALLFAAAILCESAGERPCGTCASCRDAAEFRHPDLLVLQGNVHPTWHEVEALTALAGLPGGDRPALLALLSRLAEAEVIGEPVPGPSDPRRRLPLHFARDVALAGETGRRRDDEGIAGRIDKLRERGRLTTDEARLARAIALPPLSLRLYRRGARGLGIAAITPREGGSGRSLREFLEKRPARGGRRVAVVDEAHWMTEEAQNSLLKTLEEPPPGVVLILVTESPASLLPTILSRVQRIPWRSLTEEEMVRVISREASYDAADARLLATMSGGAPGKALGEDPASYRAVRADAIALLRGSVGGDLAAVVKATARLTDGRGAREVGRERTQKAIDILLIYLRDLAAVRHLGPGAPVANADLASQIEADAARITPGVASTAARLLLEARARLLGFSEARLVLEGFAFPLFPAEGGGTRRAPRPA